MHVDVTPGDVMLTPSWCWHWHGDEAFRLDFVPLVRHIEAMFFEHHLDAFQRPMERDFGLSHSPPHL